MRMHDLRSLTVLLHRAASEGHDVIPLLERGADPSCSDVDGRRALHYAAMNGHTLTLIALSAYGADLNARTNNGRTALHGACWNGHTQTALQLIEMGADPHAKSFDGSTALMDASRNGHHETVMSLVTIFGADVRAVDVNGRSSLHYAALNGHTEMVRNLVDLSAEVEWADNDGCRPLHFASWNGHQETASALLLLGADPRSIDGNWSTPLHDAAIGGRTSTAALLLDYKADVEARNDRGTTPLHSAASSGHVDTTKLLLECKADVNAFNDDGRTALHFATWNCHPRAVLLLLQHGANMMLAGSDGVGLCHPDFDWPADLLPLLHSLRLPDTPMHFAAGHGDSFRVTALASCGVDVNCQDKVGDTPLHRAVRNRRMNTTKRLVELGADVGRSNDSGVTVDMDLICFLDSAQQETVARKLREREALRARVKAGGWAAVEEQLQAEDPRILWARVPPLPSPQWQGDYVVQAASPVPLAGEEGALTEGKKRKAPSAAGPQRTPTPLARRPPSPPLHQARADASRGEAAATVRRISSHPSMSLSSLTPSVHALSEAAPPLLQPPALLAARSPSPRIDALAPAVSPPFSPTSSSARSLVPGSHPLTPSTLAHAVMKTPVAVADAPQTERVQHHEEQLHEEEECKNPDDPSNCDPDDAHNFSAHHDQWAVHPVRRACMQVDAWVSHIPGMRVWQTSQQMGPLQAMLKKKSDLSESLTWRVATTVNELRASRERWGRSVHQTCKLLGTVTGEIVTGDYKGLASTLKELPCSKRLEPWVMTTYRDTTTRWGSGVMVLRQTLCSASKVVHEVVGGRPSNLPTVILEEASCIMETYRTGKTPTGWGGQGVGGVAAHQST